MTRPDFEAVREADPRVLEDAPDRRAEELAAGVDRAADFVAGFVLLTAAFREAEARAGVLRDELTWVAAALCCAVLVAARAPLGGSARRTRHSGMIRVTCKFLF